MKPICLNLRPIGFLVSLWLMSPLTLFAAEGSADRWGLLFGAGRFFNLALVVAVLVWAARKPLAGFYASRSENIRAQLAEAQQARLEAEAKLAEMETRMSRLDDEMRAIKAAADQEAREEYQRLLAEAERESAKVVERSREEISGMTRSALAELKQHAAELSVQLAEEKIRREIGDDDRRRLFAGFVRKLEDRP